MKNETSERLACAGRMLEFPDGSRAMICGESDGTLDLAPLSAGPIAADDADAMVRLGAWKLLA